MRFVHNSFFSKGKERYQLEIPAKSTSRVPNSYEALSQTKGTISRAYVIVILIVSFSVKSALYTWYGIALQRSVATGLRFCGSQCSS
jgi:hypothetical protein